MFAYSFGNVVRLLLDSFLFPFFRLEFRCRMCGHTFRSY